MATWTTEFPGAMTVCDRHGCQAPWFCDGAFQGLVERSLEIPGTLPHFIREG